MEAGMQRILVVLLMTFWCTAGFAKSDFEVQVPVDVEAENSVAAKDKAMIEAQRTAFLQSAVKLAGEQNSEQLEQLSDSEILYFIQSVGVDDEKSGGTKYKALLTVDVNENLLKEYLAENNMIQPEISELLVIPVYKAQTFGAPLLWEAENAWRDAWKSKGLIKFGAMNVQTISKNEYDIADFAADNALYMEAALYEEIAKLYNSDKIYVVYAETAANGDLKITVKNEKIKSENSFSVYNENNGELFDKAIEKSVMFISNMEREAKNTDGIAAVGSVNAVYAYLTMKEWLQKSKAISDLPMVEGIDTKSFGGGKVSFSINFNGTADDLWTALQELGFSHEQVDNYFIIK